MPSSNFYKGSTIGEHSRPFSSMQYTHPTDMAQSKVLLLVPILLLMLLAMAEATPPGIANHPSHATCKNKEYKNCYNLVHVCPKFCPDSCTVECASCKPVCSTGSSPPPDSDSSPVTPTPASPPPPTTTNLSPSSSSPPPSTPVSYYPPPPSSVTPPPSPPPVTSTTPPPSSSSPPPPVTTPSSPSSPSANPPKSPTPSPPTPSAHPPPTSPSSTPPSPPPPSSSSSSPPSSPPPPTSTPTTPSSSSPPSTSPTSAKKVKCKNKNYTQCYNMEHVCPSSCPGGCMVDCSACKPVCKCDQPGAVCQDPRFIGGDGITFYFHGRKDRDFCLVSDSNLHINAHFIGRRNQNMKRDFTWVQSIAVLFDKHQLFIGAQKTATWEESADHLALSFNGEPIILPEAENTRWQSASAPTVSITRVSDTNSVIVEGEGSFRITAKVVPITEEDSSVHNYGITKEDCFAHLDLGFKFFSLSNKVNGILGQTYRRDYMSQVKMGVSMPVMGREREFETSSLLAADCPVAKFKKISYSDNEASLED